MLLSTKFNMASWRGFAHSGCFLVFDNENEISDITGSGINSYLFRLAAVCVTQGYSVELMSTNVYPSIYLLY